MTRDRRDDRAVSVVVGAVLLLGIAVSALVLFRLAYVPQAGEQAEADHMREVTRALTGVDERLLATAGDADGALAATGVPTTPGYPSLVPSAGSGGTLAFRPDAGEVTVSSPDLLVHTRNGSAQLGPQDADAWTRVNTQRSLTDVMNVLGLWVNVTEPSPTDGDRLTVEVTNDAGAFAGEFRATTTVDGQVDLAAETLRPPAPGERAFHNHLLSIDQARWDTDYTLDVLTPVYGMASLIDSAERPLTLTFEDAGLDHAYLATYEERVGAGMTRLVGAGEEIAPYERRFPSGSLAYTSANRYFVDQELVIEHGALVRIQSEGETFVIEPPLQVQTTDEHASVSLSVPTLEGSSVSVSGGSVEVRTTPTSGQTIGASAGELNLTFSTLSPGLWADFLRDELEDAGLTSTNCPPTSSASSCQYELSTTASLVRLELHGPHATDADPSDPTRDLTLQQHRGQIDMEIQR